jgi:beta-glucosidase
MLAEAVQMAGTSDAVLLFAGLNSDLESEESGLAIPGFRGGDRTDIQLPPFDDYAMAGHTYRFFTGTPLYRFGHGLSYASFLYSGVQVACGETMHVTVSVTNTSARDGDEVVQLYAPELRAFERARIPAGESRTVEFATAPAPTFGFGPDVPGAYTTLCVE